MYILDICHSGEYPLLIHNYILISIQSCEQDNQRYVERCKKNIANRDNIIIEIQKGNKFLLTIKREIKVAEK